MTYPTKAELLECIAHAGGNRAKATIALGLSWAEVDEILTRGEVTEQSARYWQMVRREAQK
jgi:hypothetical protein